MRLAEADMSTDEFNREFFDRRAKQYGHDVRSLNWGSLDSQQLRFSILSEIGLSSGHSILDVGCGLGDFLKWSLGQGMELDYVGIDISSEMISLAKEAHPASPFILSSIFELDRPPSSFDYAFASGLFTYYTEGGLEYVVQTVAKMRELTRYGVACNFLKFRPEYSGEEQTFTTSQVLAAFEIFGDRLSLREDYMEHDFTIYLVRQEITE